jgi:hypothetical protein
MKPISKALRELVPDLLMVGGVACLTYGAAAIYVPAGWLVAGGFTFGFGFLSARRSSGS